jgi:hypothetical protein
MVAPDGVEADVLLKAGIASTSVARITASRRRQGKSDLVEIRNFLRDVEFW